MTTYRSINLKDILNNKRLGEKVAKQLLSHFSCPYNPDVEHFLKNSAIEFTKQGISSTYLIMAISDNKYILVGYFTLANKTFCFDANSISSRTLQRRLLKFSQYEKNIQRHFISAPLIGQLGKNFYNSYENLIDGSKLLKFALGKVQQAQHIIGGKIVFLECENKPKLLDFYAKHEFFNFGFSELEPGRIRKAIKKPLIQMLKYIR